eukprot:8180311-Ditylum_brightwellii.AAC.1
MLSRVDKLVYEEYLQFTTERWRPINGEVQEEVFTFLDVAIEEANRGEMLKEEWKKTKVLVSEWILVLYMKIRWQGDKLQF